jgi:hypothetical protein
MKTVFMDFWTTVNHETFMVFTKTSFGDFTFLELSGFPDEKNNYTLFF